MPKVGVALALVGGLLMSHALSCGGTTRSRGDGDAGSGASSSSPGGATSQGASAGQGGSSLLPIPEACLPMDAQSDGTECGWVPGYTWLGALCEPIICGCTGADCNQLFETMEACDRAHDICYERAGITRTCTSHAECRLTPRDCCPGCGELRADLLLGVRVDASTPREASLCRDPSDICVDCDFSLSPTHYPACIDGICSVVDVSEFASCLIDTDCRLVSKDCCDCGGDFSQWGVMAVNYSYARPQRCDGVGCDDCAPDAPSNIYATCLTDRGVCGVLAGTH
jgi:hypothetical protein